MGYRENIKWWVDEYTINPDKLDMSDIKSGIRNSLMDNKSLWDKTAFEKYHTPSKWCYIDTHKNDAPKQSKEDIKASKIEKAKDEPIGWLFGNKTLNEN